MMASERALYLSILAIFKFYVWLVMFNLDLLHMIQRCPVIRNFLNLLVLVKYIFTVYSVCVQRHFIPSILTENWFMGCTWTVREHLSLFFHNPYNVTVHPRIHKQAHTNTLAQKKIYIYIYIFYSSSIFKLFPLFQ